MFNKSSSVNSKPVLASVYPLYSYRKCNPVQMHALRSRVIGAYLWSLIAGLLRTQHHIWSLCFGNLKDSSWTYSLTVGSHFEYAQSELLDDTERRATFTFICFRCYCRADIKKTNKLIFVNLWMLWEHVRTLSQMARVHKCQHGEVNCSEKWITLHKRWRHEQGWPQVSWSPLFCVWSENCLRIGTKQIPSSFEIHFSSFVQFFVGGVCVARSKTVL